VGLDPIDYFGDKSSRGLWKAGRKFPQKSQDLLSYFLSGFGIMHRGLMKRKRGVPY